MGTWAWVLIGVAIVAVTSGLGVICGMVAMASYVRRHSPRAWDVLHADCAESEAIRAFALHRDVLAAVERD